MFWLTIVTSPTWTILNLLCNIGLLFRPGGPAVLACRVLPKSVVTLCTSPLAKPVVSIWFTPLGLAPLSLAASVARTPATCLEVWSGDHRQTPGGLKKSKESKSFRKKLTKRPLALRCQTQYTQAHDLGGIAMRYLDCPEGSFPWKIRQLLEHGSTAMRNSACCLCHFVDGFAWRKRRAS